VGVVGVVGPLEVDDVDDEVVVVSAEVEVPSMSDVLVTAAATSTGRALTCESAKLTICHVTPVVTTRAIVHAAASRQLIVSIVPADPSCGSQGALKIASRLLRATLLCL
jgi:CxxC motif-containing protein (DUF1111 family)